MFFRCEGLPELPGSHSGSYHLESHRSGRFAEPAVIGEGRNGIKTHNRLEVQCIKGPQYCMGRSPTLR